MSEVKNDRPITTHKLPVTKQEVVIKEYATGRELRAISNAMLDGVNYQYKGDKVESDSVPYAKADAQEDKTIEVMVVSLGGSTENIVDRVLDLPKTDYTFIKKLINEATKDSESDKETKKD